MHATIKLIIAIVCGIIIGSVFNLFLIEISGFVIKPPEGADLTTMDGLKNTMHLFQPKHFIFPFLAHSLGTFIGAFISMLMFKNYNYKFGLFIGCWFLLGGVSMVMMAPSPLWFILLDLIGAYIPMAWLAWKLIELIKK